MQWYRHTMFFMIQLHSLHPLNDFQAHDYRYRSNSITPSSPKAFFLPMSPSNYTDCSASYVARMPALLLFDICGLRLRYTRLLAMISSVVISSSIVRRRWARRRVVRLVVCLVVMVPSVPRCGYWGLRRLVVSCSTTAALTETSKTISTFGLQEKYTTYANRRTRIIPMKIRMPASTQRPQRYHVELQ